MLSILSLLAAVVAVLALQVVVVPVDLEQDLIRQQQQLIQFQLVEVLLLQVFPMVEMELHLLLDQEDPN